MDDVIDWLEENNGTLKFDNDGSCTIGALNRFATLKTRGTRAQRREKLRDAWLLLRKLVND